MRQHERVHAISILHHCAAQCCVGSLPVCSTSAPHTHTAQQNAHSLRRSQAIPDPAEPPPQCQPGEGTIISTISTAKRDTVFKLQQNSSREAMSLLHGTHRGRVLLRSTPEWAGVCASGCHDRVVGS